MRAGELIAGRYRLKEIAGAGGMGEVWRAVDQREDRVVALKRAIRAADADGERTRRLLQREAKNAARLHHPHIVAFLDEVTEGPERWLVLEYLPSQSLAQMLDRVGTLPPQHVMCIGAQIASALEAVHARGILHRDVKPGNILVTGDGTAKLTDFGISRSIHGDTTLTDSGGFAGTLLFIAPEIASGQPSTTAADVFGLGAALFAAVEGIPPFGTAEHQHPAALVRRAEAFKLQEFHLAGPLTPVLSALLERDPAKRPKAAAAREMLEELAATLTDAGYPLSWPVGSSRPRWRPRRRTVAAGLCAVVLIALGTLMSLPNGGLLDGALSASPLPIGLQHRAAAQNERDTAIFNQIIARADRLRGIDASLAAQLDLTAYRMRPGNRDRYAQLITDAGTVLSTPLESHQGPVRAVAFSHDGRILASGGTVTVRLWNTADPTYSTPLSAPLPGHTNQINAVTFSPDGHVLASASDDKTIRLWNTVDPAHPTPLSALVGAHTNYINRVAFSPDGHVLASASDDKTIRLWNTVDPAHPTPLSAPLADTNEVNAVAFSPDGHILASGNDDHAVRLWDVTDPAHPTPLGAPLADTNEVNAVAFSPDGHILASGNDDHAVRLWDVTDPAHPTPLGAPLIGHTSDVETVAFSPDGHIVASGSDDHRVRLWDVTDPAHPTPLGPPLTDHTDTVSAVAFSPDGHTLASGSDDQTIRLWNIPSMTRGSVDHAVRPAAMNLDQAIHRICAVTRNTLSPAKWNQYVSPALPYRPPCP